MFEPSEGIVQIADEIIARYPISKRSATLPLLHLIQKNYGYIADESIEWVAKQLDLEPIKILEVVTFYPGFRQVRPGRYHIRVCRTLSCAMAGSEQLMEKICSLADIDRSEVSHHHPIAKSADGRFSIEFAECLAACGTGPVCMINDDFHEDIVAENAAKLLDKYQ